MSGGATRGSNRASESRGGPFSDRPKVPLSADYVANPGSSR